MKPIVAIVGRPNVGKSTLFNRIIGRRQALVDDVPGVTRDRHYADADWNGREFILVDTGGLEKSEATISRQVHAQVMNAIEEADLLLFVLDGKNGVHSEDYDVMSLIRRSNKAVMVVVNKIDEAEHEARAAEGYRLGVDNLWMISADHGRNMGECLDELIKRLPMEEAEKTISDETSGIRVAILGRPNVGKSTLVNKLLGQERVVVHDLAGTTRDCIDVAIEYNKQDFILVDTAGIKRKGKTKEKLDKFSTLKSLRAIERADVVMVMVNAEEGMTHQDLHLAGHVYGENKALVIVANKADLLQTSYKKCEESIRLGLGELRSISIEIISAKQGAGCYELLDRVKGLYELMSRRLGTSELNQLLDSFLTEHHLPVHQGRQVKIYFATQTGVNPPTIVVFTNQPAGISTSYRRYMLNRFRETFGSIPVKLLFRKRAH